MSTAHTPAPARYFIHPESLTEGAEIGSGTRVWAFAHILPGAKVGMDCNICDHTFVEGAALIGNRVTLKCGVQIWDGVTLEDDVFVGPNATFTNDPFPRSRQRPLRFSRTRVCAGASIGANATILPGLTIGTGAMIGAGTVVTRDVPPHAIVTGNPGRVTGYVGAERKGLARHAAEKKIARREIRPGQCVEEQMLVGGARVYQLPRISDSRGCLSFAEIEQSLPFPAVRYFVVFGVPSREVRGEHAHRELHEYLVCVHGQCSVRMFDGAESAEVLLDRPDLGLHLPPMLWTTQYKYSPDAVLLVLASDIYREDDYIRGLDDYLVLQKERRADPCPRV